MLKQLVVILIIKLAAIAILFALVAIIGMLCLGGMLLTLYIVHLYLFSFDDPITATKFIVGFIFCVPFLYMMGHSWKILERYQWFQNLNKLFTFSVTDYLHPK